MNFIEWLLPNTIERLKVPETHEKEILKYPSFEKRTTLTIKLSNGDILSWSDKTYTNITNEIGRSWIDFYKWYFCRDSDNYVFIYATGRTMMRRQDIVTFNIRIDEI